MSPVERPEPGTATVLGETLRKRADLYDAIIALEQAAARPATGREPAWAASASEALHALRPEIEEHIACTESPDGLYAEINELAPRLGHKIDVLREEHRGMQAAVGSLIEDVGSAAATSESVERAREGIRELLGLLVRHRQRGADLIWETYNLDIGDIDS